MHVRTASPSPWFGMMRVFYVHRQPVPARCQAEKANPKFASCRAGGPAEGFLCELPVAFRPLVSRHGLD
jgi:hypothetical protein